MYFCQQKHNPSSETVFDAESFAPCYSQSFYWRILKKPYLKVHKRENFFSSDFEFYTFLQLVKLKY